MVSWLDSMIWCGHLPYIYLFICSNTLWGNFSLLIHNELIKWRHYRCPIRWVRCVSVRSPGGGERVPVPGIFILHSAAFIPPIMVFYQKLLLIVHWLRLIVSQLNKVWIKARPWRPDRRERRPRNWTSSTRPSCPNCWERRTTSTAPTARRKVRQRHRQIHSIRPRRLPPALPNNLASAVAQLR